jgi:hypothetical protein
MSARRQNFQNIAWFLDLFKRDLLDLDPPFQRRSVWNDKYRVQFIDTILLDFPAPAIFLFGNIDELGHTTYQVVDGKQRLMTIFDFIGNKWPVSEESPIAKFRGRYFEQLPSDNKIALFEYDFSVEYLPTNNEQVISDIFNRLNKNTSKLTAQELRHAKYNGPFITKAEELSEWLDAMFDKQMPRIVGTSRRQMKDVEIVATLLLFLEDGPKGHSVDALDEEFSSRDSEWERGQEIYDEFREIIDAIWAITNAPDGQFLPNSRFRNQADFYSLFAAVAELRREGKMPDSVLAGARLKKFIEILEETEDATKLPPRLADYYSAARAASNDAGPRTTRIKVIKAALLGDDLTKATP